jgi:hypothetical protein
MKLTNPRELSLLQVIIDDIRMKKVGYSKLTNQELSQITGIPLIAVRKKVLGLVKKQALTSILKQFESDGTYVPRRLYKGNAIG